MLCFLCLDGRSNELKPTQDGLGWVCGDDIDETITEEQDEEIPECKEEKSLEDEITEG